MPRHPHDTQSDQAYTLRIMDIQHRVDVLFRNGKWREAYRTAAIDYRQAHRERYGREQEDKR